MRNTWKWKTENWFIQFLIPALWLAGAAASDANDLTAAADDKVGNLTSVELKIYLIHRHKGAVSKVKVREQ